MAAVARSDSLQRDAAQALYERFYTSVYRYALTQVRSPQDAEDATQNTFLRAFSALQRGVVPENEAAWLFKIAHNVCLSSKLAWLRRRRVETPRDLDLLDDEPRAVELRRDELFGLDDALAAMPPRLREAFLLREWQGLSYAEIAERLDTSRSAVETLIFRARRMLAKQLESPLQRARQALGVGQLLPLLRGLLSGGSVAAKAAGVAAVVVAAGAGVTVAVQQPAHRHVPAVSHGPAAVPLARTSRPAGPAAVRQAPAAHVAPASHATRPAHTSAAVQPAAPAVAPPQADVPAAPEANEPAPASTAPAAPALGPGTAIPSTLPVTKPLPPAPVDPGAAQNVVPPLPALPTAPAAPATPAATVPAVPAAPTVTAPSVPQVSLPPSPTVTLPQPPLP